MFAQAEAGAHPAGGRDGPGESMNRNLRWVGPVFGAVFFGCLMYAVFQLGKSASSGLTASGQQPCPLPLEQAAPEAVRLRPEFRALAVRARERVADCDLRDSRNAIPVVRGKALIWDVTRDDVSEAHGRLPADVRAQAAGGDVTVFLITRQERKPTVKYTLNRDGKGTPDVQGYSVDTTLCVIDMPGPRAHGRFLISGDGTGWVVLVRAGQTEVEGNWTASVANWVEGCVRGPQWRAEAPEREWKRQHPLTPPGQEGYAGLAERAKEELRRCKAKGAVHPHGPLPAKALLWCYQPSARVDVLHGAQRLLPTDRRALPGDREVTVFVVTDTKYVRERRRPGPDGEIDRFDTTVAVVTLPDGRPVGEYTVVGDEWPTSRRRNGSHPDDPQKTFVNWVTNFLQAR
jgi:hypothetical protein